MDDHQSRNSVEKKMKKKKKRRRHEETEELKREAASSPLSSALHVAALSSPAGNDAAALQKRSKKKARKLLHLQNQDASTEEDHAEKPFSEEMKKKEKKKEKKKKKRDPLKLEELHNLHLEDESLRKKIAYEQKDYQNSDEGDVRRDNGDKKRSKKKKGEHDGDQHSEEGTLLGKNNMEEEKRSKKKKEKEKEKKRKEGKVEKAESLSQKMSTQFSGEDHEHAEEKKAGFTTMEIDMGVEGGNLGSNHSVKEHESAASKARKSSKKASNTVQRGYFDPASEEDHALLNNSIECSQRPLAGQSQHGPDTSMSIVSHSKEKEKGKKTERKRKRVTFQNHINVADEERVRDNPNSASKNSIVIAEEVWGVRFTTDEDEILKDAVWNYIKSKGWDEQEGLNKVFNSKKHKDARNCWADIKLALPHRPRQAIRYRAHLLLEKGAHAGKWSEEEEQLLRRLQGEHGRKWKEISALIDRHRTSIKEKWRSLKRMKAKGEWTQGELQQLSDLVHKCLRAKASSPVNKKETDRHILRDDINWEKIADTIGTHNHGSCCGKWYYNLQSSLVTEGVWANEDDLLLLESLLESGACVEEEVEWDSLLSHRSGHVCVTRWKQMVKQLGENRTRQFLDKLDILARRFAPELLESSVQEMSIENSSVK